MRAAWTREVDDWAKPEIRRFERLDAEAREARGDAARERAVVFVGSSIFREWREIRDFDRDWEGTASRLAGTPRFVNTAFGGSTTTDVLRHASSCVSFETRDVRAVVYYCGSNDISVGVEAKTVRDNFVEFAEHCRARARAAGTPRLGVVFVGVIDSPQKRMFGMSDVVRETNALCREWCEKTPDSAFVDVTEVFERRDELFREDATHLKPEAYDFLAAAIAPVVESVCTGVLDESVKEEATRSGRVDDDFLPPSMRSHA